MAGEKRNGRHRGRPWSGRDDPSKYAREPCIVVQPSFCIVDLSRRDNQVPSLSVEDFRDGGRKEGERRTGKDFLREKRIEKRVGYVP